MSGADPTGNGGALAGFADQRNIELLVEAGLTCSQAVQISTANAAKFLGELDRMGPPPRLQAAPREPGARRDPVTVLWRAGHQLRIDVEFLVIAPGDFLILGNPLHDSDAPTPAQVFALG